MQNMETITAIFEEGIAGCRNKIRQAAGTPQETAAFERDISQFYTAAGRTESDAAALAAGVRVYIESVPSLLERLLQSALEPDVPDAWVWNRLEVLHAALHLFESSSAIPDQLGLTGLLDNAYLALRLLPEEMQVGLNHEQAIQLLGPLTIRELDRKLDAYLLDIQAMVRARLGAMPERGTPSLPNMTEPSAAHGDCVNCINMRYGTPIVQTVYDNLIEAVRSSARKTFTEKLGEERKTSNQFIEELEALKRHEDQFYTRRPTEKRIMYCGVDEFDDVYQACEVKNLDQKCTQFQAKPAQVQPHTCSTCRHHYQIPSSVYHTVLQVAGHDSRSIQAKILDDIKMTVEALAQSELEECIEYGGFLGSGRPGTLPYCEARSRWGAGSETRYVVGPAVNIANQCDRWEAGTNENITRLTGELSTLVAEAKLAWHDDSHPSVVDSSWGNYHGVLRNAAANADADVIEFGLSALNVYPSSVESICISYVNLLGYLGAERTPRASRSGLRGGPEAPYRRKEAPFVVEAGKIYHHPEKKHLLTVERLYERDIVHVRIDVQLVEFRIRALPQDKWQAVTIDRAIVGKKSEERVPVVLRVSRGEKGDALVHAAWL